MKLADWLRERDLTASEFAESIGVAVSTITRTLRNERRPEWPTMEKILAATNGEVTPNDFLPGTDEATQPADAAA